MVEQQLPEGKIITCSLKQHESKLLAEEIKAKCSSCVKEKTGIFYSCQQPECEKKKNAFNCQECAQTRDYRVKCPNFTHPMFLQSTFPACLKGKEANFICYFCKDPIDLKKDKDYYTCGQDSHLKFKKGACCLKCANWMQNYNEEPYTVEQAPITFLEKATESEITGLEFKKGKGKGDESKFFCQPGVLLDRNLYRWIQRFENKSKDPFYGTRENVVTPENVHGIILVNDEFSSLPNISTGEYQAHWAKYFLEQIAVKDNIRELYNKKHSEIDQKFKTLTIDLMKQAQNAKSNEEYIKPVVFIMSQGYADINATHHVINDENNDQSLFNVEYYMEAMSSVATVVRVANTYKISGEKLAEDLEKFSRQLKEEGIKESRRLTNRNFLRFINNYHQVQNYFMKNVIDNFISSIEDDDCLLIQPSIADQAQKQDVVLCEARFDLDVYSCVKANPILRSGFMTILHSDFFLDLPHLPARKAREWIDPDIHRWAQNGLYGDPNQTEKRSMVKESLNKDQVFVINRMVARLAVQDAMRTANQTDIAYTDHTNNQELAKLRQVQENLQKLRKECISEFLNMKEQDQKNYITNYKDLIEKTFDCLVKVVLKKAWIDEQAFADLNKELPPENKNDLIMQELANVSKCTDIQRHVITAILAGGDIRPEQRDKNPFHVGSLAEIDKNLPETQISTKVALLIGVQQYDNLLEKDTKRRIYADINQSSTDIHVMHNGLRKMGFKNHEINVLWNPSNQAVNKSIANIYKVMREAEKINSSVFLFIYFTGHGESDDKQVICVNDPSDRTNVYRYRLDEKFRALLNNKPHYGMVIYDCCRTKFMKSSKDEMDISNISKDGFGKVLTSDKKIRLGEKSAISVHKDNNFIFIYSCPPSAGVPARSAVARYVMYYLSTQVTSDNKLWFPSAFRQYKGYDGQTECNIKVNCKFYLDVDQEFTKYTGVFNILDNPEFPAAKNVFQDIIYDSSNEKNYKLISAVICKLFNTPAFMKIVEVNQIERLKILMDENTNIKQYAKYIVQAANKLNQDAQEYFYNTAGYLHFEDRHALNQAYYSMLGSKDKQERLTTIVCSHADQEPMELNHDTIKSLKGIQDILFEKLAKKKANDPEFAYRIQMIESQAFYFDERMLVFDFMRQILIDKLNIAPEKLKKFRLRITNLLEALYTETGQGKNQLNQTADPNRSVKIIDQIKDSLNIDVGEELQIFGKISLDNYVKAFVDLLKPSMLKISVVSIDFCGIEINRAATTYEFIYSSQKDGKKQTKYVQGNWPEQTVEFDIEEASDDTELEINVLYRESKEQLKKPIVIGSVKFLVKQQFINDQPCINFTETVSLNPLQEMNEYLRYRKLDQGEGLFCRVQEQIRIKNGDKVQAGHQSPKLDLHFQVINIVQKEDDQKEREQARKQKREEQNKKVQDQKDLESKQQERKENQKKEKESVLIEEEELDQVVNVLKKQELLGKGASGKYIEEVLENQELLDGVQFGTPVSQKIFMMYKEIIEANKEIYKGTFSIFNANKDEQMQNIKEEVNQLLKEINQLEMGSDANVISLRQYKKWYEKHHPGKDEQEAEKKFKEIDLDGNGTQEKWEIIRFKAQDIYKNYVKKSENEINELLKLMDAKLKTYEQA